MAIGSITGVFLLYVDVIILGKFVALEFIGFYRAAITIVLSVMAIVSFAPVLYPVFSQISGRRLKKIFDKLVYYTSIIAIPATLGLIFITRPLIIAIYGQAYIPAAIPLYALSFLIFSFGIGDLFTFLLNAKGKSKYTAKAMIVATSLNIILSIAFIIFLLPFGEIYAVLGVTFATLISRYYNFFALAFFSRKLLRIKLDYNHFIKPLIASIIMAFFLFLFNHLLQEKLTVPILIIEILLAMLVYFIALFLFRGIHKSDINYLVGISKQLSQK